MESCKDPNFDDPPVLKKEEIEGAGRKLNGTNVCLNINSTVLEMKYGTI